MMKVDLTHEFRKTVQASHVRRDARFRRAPLTEAFNEFLVGDLAIGKRLSRDRPSIEKGFGYVVTSMAI